MHVWYDAVFFLCVYRVPMRPMLYMILLRMKGALCCLYTALIVMKQPGSAVTRLSPVPMTGSAMKDCDAVGTGGLEDLLIKLGSLPRDKGCAGLAFFKKKKKKKKKGCR
jgi:hypothetical protein